MREREERRGDGVRLSDFEETGIRVVAERAPHELVIGLLGQFWTPRGALDKNLTSAHFASPPPSGFALAGWNFTTQEGNNGTTELFTETRVLCAPDARRKFRTYWFFVRPGSGLIRREMLNAIRLEAERAESV